MEARSQRSLSFLSLNSQVSLLILPFRLRSVQLLDISP